MNFHIAHLRPLSQIDVEYDVGQHVGFIELPFGLYLNLEVAGRDKAIAEVVARLDDDVLLVRRLSGNIDDLQESRIGKYLTCTREVEDCEVEYGLEFEG